MGRTRWLGLPGWQVFLIFFLGSAGSLACAQTEGDRFLVSKEQQVQELAEKAVENYEDACGLVASCEGSQCSIAGCRPLSDYKHYDCVKTANSTITGCSCNTFQADYTRSYVRVPLLDDAKSINVERVTAICAQRKLDDTFRSFLNNGTYYSFYLGTVDGTFRLFPGTAVQDCNDFDPRLRPWYVGAISVVKDLVVLVDVSSSMGHTFGFFDSTTPLERAIKLTEQLLDTLTEEDRATVISYYGNQSSQLGQYSVGDPVKKTDNGLVALLRTVSNLAPSTVANSDTTAAISQALQVFNSSSEGALKVIVVFTDGKSTVPQQGLDALVDSLNTNQSTVFVYQINDDNNQGLLDLVCNSNLSQGYYEVLQFNPLQNPAYALKSYFSFLARARNMSSNLVFWQQPYSDYNFLGTVITVAYPAISAAGDLVAVAGIDVQVSELNQPLVAQITTALGQPTRTTKPPKSVGVPRFTQCNGGVNNGSTACSASSVTSAKAVCSQEGDKHTYQERLCCPGCGGFQPPKPKTNLTPLWIVLGIVGGLAIIGLLYFVWRKCTQSSFPPPPPPLPPPSAPGSKPRIVPVPDSETRSDFL